VSGGERRNADAALIAALAAGKTVEASAKIAGVSVATAHRRLAEDGFKQRVTAARDEMIARAVGQLSEAAADAVAALRDLLKPATPPAVRLGAARAALEMVLKGREATDLADEIAAFRRELEERGEGASEVMVGALRRQLERLKSQLPPPEICPEHRRRPFTSIDLRDTLYAFSPIEEERAIYKAEQDRIAATPPCGRCGWRPEAIYVVAVEDWGQHGRPGDDAA
jgi:hypothetical protein